MGVSTVSTNLLESRHAVWTNNKKVQALNILEQKYQDNPEELRKVINIRITTDWIYFSLDEWKTIGIKHKHEYWEKTDKPNRFCHWIRFFQWDEAMRKFGNAMITKDEFESILSAIPGQNDGSHYENIQPILGLPVSGIRLLDWTYKNINDDEIRIWTGSGWSGNAYYACIKKNNQHKLIRSCNAQSGFPVRLRAENQ